MAANQTIPAAQYLRVSTEHQQYSLENQSAAIQAYAESHNFEVVGTYSDAGKSGLGLRHRTGLRQLLRAVVAGTSGYQAILVYDVSRWGRFQDTDESAHYEFLCKSVGVPVIYCAETFANDGTLSSLIMKALKRTMAGEYSRELGVKVMAGQERLARLGFKQGGMPGFGLRRMLVSPTGVRKQELALGERKSIATDRVILVPGPADEVECVRDIFRMLLSRKQTVHAISRDLNRRGVRYRNNSQWDYSAVYAVLTHPKYMGCHIFGRTSGRLCAPTLRLPKSKWIVKPAAFDPIVDPVIFAEAQKILVGRTVNQSDEEMLNRLSALATSKGRLTLRLIEASDEIASSTTYRRRFGSLRRACQLIGYSRPEQFVRSDRYCRTIGLREELVANIVEMFPNEVSIVRRGGTRRPQLRLSNGLVVSTLLARSRRIRSNALRWMIDPAWDERQCVTLLARLHEDNCSFLDFHVLPGVDRPKVFRLSLSDAWLSRGERLSELSHFCEVAVRVHEGK